MTYDEYLKRENTLRKEAKEFIPCSTYSRFLNKDLLICKCGWEGTVFNAMHFTTGELNALTDITPKAKQKALQQWGGSMCPNCHSTDVLKIQDSFNKARRFIEDIAIKLGWGDIDNSVFPLSYRFLHRRTFDYPTLENVLLKYHTKMKDEEIALLEEEIMSTVVKCQEAGDLAEVKVGTELLAKLRFPGLVVNSADVVNILKTHLTYLDSLEEVYMSFDMDTKWASVQAEKSITDRYLQMIENLLRSKYGLKNI